MPLPPLRPDPARGLLPLHRVLQQHRGRCDQTTISRRSGSPTTRPASATNPSLSNNRSAAPARHSTNWRSNSRDATDDWQHLPHRSTFAARARHAQRSDGDGISSGSQAHAAAGSLNKVPVRALPTHRARCASCRSMTTRANGRSAAPWSRRSRPPSIDADGSASPGRPQGGRRRSPRRSLRSQHALAGRRRLRRLSQAPRPPLVRSSCPTNPSPASPATSSNSPSSNGAAAPPATRPDVLRRFRIDLSNNPGLVHVRRQPRACHRLAAARRAEEPLQRHPRPDGAGDDRAAPPTAAATPASSPGATAVPWTRPCEPGIPRDLRNPPASAGTPTGSRWPAGWSATRQPAHRPRARQPPVGRVVRHRPGRDPRGFRQLRRPPPATRNC